MPFHMWLSFFCIKNPQPHGSSSNIQTRSLNRPGRKEKKAEVSFYAKGWKWLISVWIFMYAEQFKLHMEESFVSMNMSNILWKSLFPSPRAPYSAGQINKDLWLSFNKLDLQYKRRRRLVLSPLLINTKNGPGVNSAQSFILFHFDPYFY